MAFTGGRHRVATATRPRRESSIMVNAVPISERRSDYTASEGAVKPWGMLAGWRPAAGAVACLLVRESRFALLEKRRAFLRGVRGGLGDGNRPALQLDCRLETAHALVEPQRLFREPDAHRHIDPDRPGQLQR